LGDGDGDEGQRDDEGDVEPRAAVEHGADHFAQPGSQPVVLDDVVEDDL
jgi:hypothetical protein